jgi:hypothetical protein
MKFRKKPVVIDAWLWFGDSINDARRFCDTSGTPRFSIGSINGKAGLIIPTLEGNHLAQKGDWIIRGVNGEYYPCKPDIFEKTYEVAE